MRQMHKKEYRDLIDELGLSQARIAIILDIAERTSRRYALGVSPIPNPVAILLRAMAADKLTAKDIDRFKNN